MDRKLRRYVTNKANFLDRAYVGIDAEDLIGDAWSIFLTCNDNKKAFLKIRRHFNKIKMRAIREARRRIPLEFVENEIELAENPENAMIAAIDLEQEIKDYIQSDSVWKARIAKMAMKEYRDAI
jgi:hypothetical protein